MVGNFKNTDPSEVVMDTHALIGTLAAEHTLPDDGFLALLSADEADGADALLF